MKELGNPQRSLNSTGDNMKAKDRKHRLRGKSMEAKKTKVAWRAGDQDLSRDSWLVNTNGNRK